MAETGWVKLHRKVMDNDLWKDKPFARGQAWTDLIMLASHEDKKIWFDGVQIDIMRGSFVTSIRKLSERWGWSRTKTRRFLNDLENAQMLNIKCDTKKTTIEILNYKEYQGTSDTSGNSKKATESVTEKPQKSHKKATKKHNQEEISNDISKKKRNKEALDAHSPSGELAASEDDLPDLDDIEEVDFSLMTPEEFERWVKEHGTI